MYPSFFQVNLGLGAASGLHSMVIFLPSAPYISDSKGFFLNDGRNAVKIYIYKSNKFQLYIIFYLLHKEN